MKDVVKICDGRPGGWRSGIYEVGDTWVLHRDGVKEFPHAIVVVVQPLVDEVHVGLAEFGAIGQILEDFGHQDEALLLGYGDGRGDRLPGHRWCHNQGAKQAEEKEATHDGVATFGEFGKDRALQGMGNEAELRWHAGKGGDDAGEELLDKLDRVGLVLGQLLLGFLHAGGDVEILSARAQLCHHRGERVLQVAGRAPQLLGERCHHIRADVVLAEESGPRRRGPNLEADEGENPRHEEVVVLQDGLNAGGEVVGHAVGARLVDGHGDVHVGLHELLHELRVEL
mmetsp:Transcript_6203/g.17506  ORF Transcript_6203/g.17506 Transcript_6203/m.17506 type:complete len:284 (+) Transcript_6203:2045-2896(+)